MQRHVPFPQELVDIVLNELRDDTPTLKSCVLVSHAFVPTSRTHIFSRLRLTPPSKPRDSALTRCQEFYQLLNTSPHLALYVKDLELVEGLSATDWERGLAVERACWGYTWLASGRTLPLLLPLLVNLRSISVASRGGYCLDWRRVSRTVKTSLRGAFAMPTVTCARLHCVQGFSNLGEVFALFKSPGLKELTILGVHASGASAQIDGVTYPIDNRPQLDTLTMRLCSSFPQYICGSQSTVDIRRVRKLRVFDLNDEDFHLLLNAMGGSIEHLELLSPGAGSFMHIGQQPINLRNCHRLRILTVGLTAPYEGSIFARLIPTLRSLVTPRIEEITLELAVYRPCDVSHWTELDNVLTSPEMFSLKRVQVKVFMIDGRTFRGGFLSFTSFADTARTGLCVLSARSMLHIEQVSREGMSNSEFSPV